MARTRRSASSPRPAAAAPPARTTPPPPHQQQQQHHNTHQTTAQQPQPQVTNVYVQRGGMGSGLLGNVASVAAGSVIGHGISHMLFDRNAPPAQPTELQQVAQQVGNGACAAHVQTYAKCLEANEGNAAPCKWAWETFTQCQSEQQPTQ
ncbi:hypothetical protein, conserved [Trypanosoma brucei gambiense DAL972]|uniref:CHCH domain-containing protein n=1 Tax=Trypanosoma brucei gambiense (strain MHOM/CI/86/DAL972) TaxID=679716 RepID=C9ZY60_TRYB9|nr:hypothetical protein, conserved [Trypanosoma brucei gambiense DAL972]CBH14359.1 hypothetical protein, conserved [Trypanosoma brucei gambiense DAL972]|eukprot:XP_011776625.1 hypothetical protein, conserved [Trypanosoma brucei gambiense DAL972]